MSSQEKVKDVVKFLTLLKHTKGKWAGHFFEMEEWQDKIVREVFGTLTKEGKRQYRTAYIEIPRKNGKTYFAAALALYMLFIESKNDSESEIYSAAADREQASLVFNQAASMIRANPALAKQCNIIDSQKRIVYYKTGSFYRAIPAEAAGAHGYNASCIIVDELHTQPNRDLVDTLITSQGAREQPLTIFLTTAGYDQNSICWEYHEYARQIGEKVIKDPTFYGVIYAADETDDWTKKATWEKANPNLGVSINEDFLRQEANKARQVPAYQNTFKRLYLNIWCVVPETLITMQDGSLRRADMLQVGDQILSYDEKADGLVGATVKRVKSNGITPAVRITTSRGRQLCCTPNHKFWVRYGRSDNPKYGWREAVDLRESDRIAVSLGSRLPLGSRRMNAEEAYFLGVITGDGSIGVSGNGIRISNKTREVIDRCEAYVKTYNCTLRQIDDYHWDVRHAMHSKKIMPVKLRIKRKYKELWGKKSHEKRIPERVFKGGNNVWSAFLSGYLDTDGHVADRAVIWVSVCKELLRDCQYLLSYMGVQSDLRDGGAAYRLEVRDGHSLKLLANLLRPANPEKAEKLKGLSDLTFRKGKAAIDRIRFDRVSSIEVLDDTETIGIEVENTHTHITNGLITHNTAQEERWLDLAAWDATAGIVVPEKLEGRECYGGLDLSSTTDVSALVLIFPADDGSYDVLPYFWLPGDDLHDRINRDKVPYDVWSREGRVHLTDGNVIHYGAIREKINQLQNKYNIKEIAYDRWNASKLVQDLQDDGFEMVPIGQGYASMNAPTQDLLKLVLERTLRHGGNPVLRWMADCVTVKQDPAGNIKPVKPDRRKSSKRIDGIVALIMAVDRAMRHEGPSVYESRGVVTV